MALVARPTGDPEFALQLVRSPLPLSTERACRANVTTPRAGATPPHLQLSFAKAATLDPLDVDQWEFSVLPTTMLDEKVPTQKTIAMSSLLKLALTKVRFEGLTDAIVKTVGASTGSR